MSPRVVSYVVDLEWSHILEAIYIYIYIYISFDHGIIESKARYICSIDMYKRNKIIIMMGGVHVYIRTSATTCAMPPPIMCCHAVAVLRHRII